MNNQINPFQGPIKWLPWVLPLSANPCSIWNSSAKACMSGVISQLPFSPQCECSGWVLHLSNPIWFWISSNSSAATACLLLPISTSRLVLAISGLRAWCTEIVGLKVDESSVTFARKWFLELGILVKKISMTFWAHPRLYGFNFPS